MKLLISLLHRIPYVRRMAEERDERKQEVSGCIDEIVELRRELDAAVEHCSHKRDQILVLEKQLRRSKGDVQFLFDQHKELESQNAQLRALNAALADEVLEYRKRLFPDAKSIVVSPAVSDAIDRKEWVCSCQKRHQFYIVSCDTCMRTRPPRTLPPSPSSHADRSDIQQESGGNTEPLRDPAPSDSEAR